MLLLNVAGFLCESDSALVVLCLSQSILNARLDRNTLLSKWNVVLCDMQSPSVSGVEKGCMDLIACLLSFCLVLVGWLQHTGEPE